MLSRTELIDRYRITDRATPQLRVNFIASLDGAATRDGLSGGLNNADDKVVFDTLRMLSDVILVGAGTVRAEGYGGVRLDDEAAEWRVENGMSAQPPVAVVSARLSLPPTHPFFTDAVIRPLLITAASAPADRRAALAEVADVLVCGDDSVEPPRMLAELADRGYAQVLCEGGPRLFGELIAADCVDEFCLTLSPVLESGAAGRIAQGSAVATRQMKLLHSFPAGDMLFLRYARR